MATSMTPDDRRAEALAFIRASQERMLQRRERVLRSLATMRRAADRLRDRRR